MSASVGSSALTVPSATVPAPSGAQGTPATQAAPATSPAPGSTTGSAKSTMSAAACVTRVLGGMTLAERVGQLFMVGVSGAVAGPQLTAGETSYHFGSLLLNKTADGTVVLAARTAAMQQLGAAHDAGVRLYIAANQEGGEIQQLTGPGFATMPSALQQGTWALSTLRAQADRWGKDLHAAGVNLDIAPVMGVVPQATAASNAPIGALDREFGYNPVTVGEDGTAFIQGMTAAGVATVAKHFPGLGRVAGNTDFTANVVDDVTTPNDPYLGAFGDSVRAGVPMVMVALATYTKIDAKRLAVFSPTVMGLLRKEFGFNGVIMSDDLGEAVAVQSIAPGTRAISFLAAGGDMITSQTLAPAEQMAAAVLAKASSDASFRSLVDAAAQRVLVAKQASGLLPC